MVFLCRERFPVDIIISCNPRSMARTRLSRRLMIMPMWWRCLTVWKSSRRSMWQTFIRIILPKGLCIRMFQQTQGRVFLKWGRLIWRKWLWSTWKRGIAARQVKARGILLTARLSIELDRNSAPAMGTAAPDFGLTFLFWFWDDSRLSPFGSFCIFLGFRSYFLIF